MKGRFRVRTRDGKELRPTTTELFAELIRTGAIVPDDLVFDALTGKWIFVKEHPMALLARDPLVADAPEPRAETAVATNPKNLEPALELVEPQPLSPEEEARAFIQRMEEERRADSDEPALSREIPLVVESSEGSGSARETGSLLRPAKMGKRAPSQSPAPAASGPSRVQGSHEAGHRADPGMHPGELLPWRRIAVSGLVATLSLGGLAAFAAVARPSLRVGDRMSDFVEDPAIAPRPEHRLDDTEEAVRGAAYAGFLESVDGLRRSLDVGAVPRAWLTGPYLANPADHPEVRRYWEGYLGFVEQAKANESRLYRQAYLGALDEAGATGPVRSLRLATALGDFDANAANRGEAYARAWELAASALALHDTLMELRGRVKYEPARGPRVSADPVIEAVGTDSDAQLRFDAALDRVLRALKVGDQPLEPDAIPDWLAKSLREAHGNTSLTH